MGFISFLKKIFHFFTARAPRAQRKDARYAGKERKLTKQERKDLLNLEIDDKKQRASRKKARKSVISIGARSKKINDLYIKAKAEKTKGEINKNLEEIHEEVKNLEEEIHEVEDNIDANFEGLKDSREHIKSALDELREHSKTLHKDYALLLANKNIDLDQNEKLALNRKMNPLIGEFANKARLIQGTFNPENKDLNELKHQVNIILNGVEYLNSSLNHFDEYSKIRELWNRLASLSRKTSKFYTAYAAYLQRNEQREKLIHQAFNEMGTLNSQLVKWQKVYESLEIKEEAAVQEGEDLKKAA